MLFRTDDGVSLHYLDEGQGAPVLLLHGFPLNGESFRPQIDALSPRYRLLVPDHRGFGRSGLAPGQEVTEMSRIARDALALLDHLRIPAAVIGGLSMGGYATMALLRHDPGRVRGLVLADTRATEDDAAGKKRREELARATLERGSQVLVEAFLPLLLSANAAPALRNQVGEMIAKCPPLGAAAALRGMAARGDSQDILARYAGPALILVGEKDALTPVENSSQMLKLMSGARLIVIPGAGHLSNMEAPDAFNRSLDDLLSEL